jgi:hypothetical protein
MTLVTGFVLIFFLLLLQPVNWHNESNPLITVFGKTNRANNYGHNIIARLSPPEKPSVVVASTASSTTAPPVLEDEYLKMY